ncbi:DUF6006 family protein [Tumidithrix elongata RA019]|uniref:DUF6006 family protein n=2 Tax=Tumidithrix TaxID=3088355 RepID=A0AAW9Q3K0_9CYAN|nr:DUF6006 family protein [Tumidithrix elongata RA019]
MKFALIPLSLFLASGQAIASQVATEWYFGRWNCNIDGRSARMQWSVVNDPQTNCSGGVCSTTSGVRIVGRFSDNGSAWVPLAKQRSSSTTLNIRYLGAEQDNWFLRYDRSSNIANGWTTWRGNRYSLRCWR